MSESKAALLKRIRDLEKESNTLYASIYKAMLEIHNADINGDLVDVNDIFNILSDSGVIL